MNAAGLLPLENRLRARVRAHANRMQPQYAIRPTIRNNNVLNRDEVIRIVASAVGEEHKVDLKNYDLLILVDVYRVSRAMAEVGCPLKLTG